MVDIKLTEKELEAIDTIAKSTLSYREVARCVDAYREGLKDYQTHLTRDPPFDALFEAGQKARKAAELADAYREEILPLVGAGYQRREISPASIGLGQEQETIECPSCGAQTTHVWDECCSQCHPSISRSYDDPSPEGDMTEKEKKPWWIGEYGPELNRKTYGRIWVRTEADRVKVLDLIKEVDPGEYETYMPKDFVAVMPEDLSKAKLVYGHKFEIRTDQLELACWKAGVEIWIVTGHRDG